MKIGFREMFSVVLMSGCLLFLTAVNFFLYPPNADISHSHTNANSQSKSEDLPVSIPTEEKSTESGLSLIEELFHEQHLHGESNTLNKMFQHIVAEAGKLQVVHSERFTPPPEVS